MAHNRNESWHTKEWVIGHILMSHVPHMHESFATSIGIMPYMWVCHVALMNYTYAWVMWAHMNESWCTWMCVCAIMTTRREQVHSAQIHGEKDMGSMGVKHTRARTYTHMYRCDIRVSVQSRKYTYLHTHVLTRMRDSEWEIERETHNNMQSRNPTNTSAKAFRSHTNPILSTHARTDRK